MIQRSQGKRLWLLFLPFFILYLFLGIRLFERQLLQHAKFKKRAASQHYPTLTLKAERGEILDRQRKPLALTHATESLYFDSRQILNKEEVARLLSEKLDLSPAFLRERVRRDKSFVWVKRKLSPELSQEIKALKLKGVNFKRETKRVYPSGSLAGHLLGFVDIDNKGLEGVERYYHRLLQGEDGFRKVLRDAKQRVLPQTSLAYRKPANGLTLVLTLDEVIQHIAERALERAHKKWHAKGATVVVMDPWSGEILALANRPTYDPNDPGTFPAAWRRNRAITDLFEPGSVFKIITAATALEEGLFKEEDRIFCENGAYRISNHTLHDIHPYGSLTFREVIVKSSNIGTVKIAQKIGAKRLHQYIRAFGFGQKTGIDLPGEISGMVRPPRKWWGTSIANIPIGQGIGVTVIQLACAMGVIANGGEWMKPHILKEVLNSDGSVVKSYPKTPPRSVLQESVTARLRDILVGVVEKGTGKRAKLKGYRAGGKTGTSQKLDAKGRYSSSAHIASFVGFAPYPNPRIVVAVMVDDPSGKGYGGVVAAPVFQEVSEGVLRYLEVPSDTRQGTQVVLGYDQKNPL
ncbi:MAG: penicillin-binding protein [Bacteroidetes bacterium]|nr:penicillin-binding protein [Bacteroidota bacterium]